MRRRSILILVAILAVFVPVFEVTIRQNKIRDVDRLDSVGQLTPLILAVGQLLAELYSVGWRWIEHINATQQREDPAIGKKYWRRCCCCFSFLCCFGSGGKDAVPFPQEDGKDEQEDSGGESSQSWVLFVSTLGRC
jgi:hypothetical protein